MNNVFILEDGTTVVNNGGEPLKDCPTTWKEARIVQDQMNEGKIQGEDIMWGFDCGFKLDFDGSLIDVCSRFYPPKSHYGNTWDGSVDLYLGEDKVSSKKFSCETLKELQSEVEDYVNSVKKQIKQFLLNSLSNSNIK